MAGPSTISRLPPAKHFGRAIFELGKIGTWVRIRDAKLCAVAEDHTHQALELCHNINVITASFRRSEWGLTTPAKGAELPRRFVWRCCRKSVFEKWS